MEGKNSDCQKAPLHIRGVHFYLFHLILSILPVTSITVPPPIKQPIRKPVPSFLGRKFIATPMAISTNPKILTLFMFIYGFDEEPNYIFFENRDVVVSVLAHNYFKLILFHSSNLHLLFA